jgi:phosphoserine phosphatase RsbU/P
MGMNRGIALRLSLLILSGITVIFSIVFSYNYLVSRQIIRENVERNAESLTLSTVNKIDSVLRAVERVPVTLAAVLEGRNPGRTEVIELLRAVIENNPDIYGAAVAFEPYVHREDVRAFAPYFFRREGKLEFTEIPYEYFLWDWYQVPREIDAPVWTEPYFDEGAGGIMMATFSVPFYRNSGGGGRSRAS